MGLRFKHWGAAIQRNITGQIAPVDEPVAMEYSLVAPPLGGPWGPRKQYEYLRSLRNPNVLQRGMNADLLDGKHLQSIYDSISALYQPLCARLTLLCNQGQVSLAASLLDSVPNIYAGATPTYGIAVGADFVSLVLNGASVLKVSGDGKVTIPGLIDPTGLELTPVAANPGGVAANTLWADSGAGNRFKVGSNTLAYTSELPSLSGLLTSANNLSDVANKDTSLANLIGGGTSRTPTELHDVGLRDSFGTDHGRASLGAVGTLILQKTSVPLSFGGTPTLGAQPRWHKITVPYNQAGIGDQASPTADATAFVLPSGGMIHAVVFKTTAAWSVSGSGRCSLSLGIAGNLAKYAAAFLIDTAVSNTNLQLSTVPGIEAIGATTNIRLAADATLGLNTATTGSTDVYVLLSAVL